MDSREASRAGVAGGGREERRRRWWRVVGVMVCWGVLVWDGRRDRTDQFGVERRAWTSA